MIKSKYTNIIIAILVALALVFTIVFTYFPNILSIEQSSKVQDKQYESKLFSKNEIMSVDIQIDEDDWTSMLENATSEEYVNCDIVINGTTYKNVGIRPKGNTTLTQIASDDTTDRYSFKIEFDHYVSDQTCYGLDKLVLNNCMSDATYMKEYLSYDLMTFMDVVSPLYTYASVSVNGETWGLYLALEAVEESFAERNYGSDYGQLYKPESTNMGGGQGVMDKIDISNIGKGDNMPEMPTENTDATNTNGNDTTNSDIEVDGNDDTNTTDAQTGVTTKGGGNNRQDMGGGMSSSAGGTDLVYTDDDVDSYSAIFESSVFDSDNSDYERVIEALKNLSDGTELEKYIDVDACLRYFAVNTVLVNLDSYFGNLKHNYYLYEKDGQLTMLPWDYNLAFGGFQSGTASSAVNFAIDTPVSGTTLEERPILGKLLEVDEYKELYHQYLQQIVTEYFDSGLFEETVDSVNELIKDEVANDPTAFYTYEEYETAVETIKTFGILRAESIQGQLDGTIPSTEEGQTADSSSLIDASGINLSDMGTQGGGQDEGQGMQGGGMPNFGDGNNQEFPQGGEGQGPPDMDNGTDSSNASEQDKTSDSTTEETVVDNGTNTTNETKETNETNQTNETTDNTDTTNTNNQFPQGEAGGNDQQFANMAGNNQGNQQVPSELSTIIKTDSTKTMIEIGVSVGALILGVIFVKFYSRRKYKI